MPKEYVKGYKEKGTGTVNEWAESVQPILGYNVARFMLSASFASPLLKMLKCRSFVIYVYGSTRGGKTSATKVALSVWGNPEEALINFSATPTAIERTASLLKNIPIGID